MNKSRWAKVHKPVGQGPQAGGPRPTLPVAAAHI